MNKLTKIKNKIKLTVKMKFKKDRAEKIKLSNKGKIYKTKLIMSLFKYNKCH